MGQQYRENYRRMLGKRYEAAADNPDLVTVEDLVNLQIGSGLPPYRVKNINASGTYTLEESDDLVVMRASGDYALTLPTNPPVGTRVEIKDGAGDGATATKRIYPAGGTTIDGFTYWYFYASLQSWSLIWAGDTWKLV